MICQFTRWVIREPSPSQWVVAPAATLVAVPRFPSVSPDRLHVRFREALAAEMRRRDLEAWMRTHRAEVAALLKGGDMDWTAAARHFAAAGMLVDGQRPNATTAEAAWRRVSKRNAGRV